MSWSVAAAARLSQRFSVVLTACPQGERIAITCEWEPGRPDYLGTLLTEKEASIYCATRAELLRVLEEHGRRVVIVEA
jgi:hypothetical protein